MDPNPRQFKLLALAKTEGSVSVERLAQALGVTLQTVRRDVQRLSDEGLLKRFHGGVRMPGSTVENMAHQQRVSLNAAGKARIAKAVAAAVPNDCSLILNIGTTTEAIARALVQHAGLRVITNNLNVASILSVNPQCEVIVVGGVVRGRDQGIVGEAAVDFIRQFKVDIALIGISGIFQVAQERIVSPQPDHFSTPALPAGAALVLGRALDPDTLNPVQEFLPMTLKCFELFCGLHRLQGRRSPGQHNARVTCRNHRKNQTEPMAFRCNSGLSE